MNKILFRILGSILFSITLFSCTENDYGSADQTKTPSISEYKSLIKATVDQTTNLVTLKIDSKEIMPVWIFEDGTTSNTNEYQKTVRLAGTYTVQAKVSNKYGISDGAVTVTYTINNTLVDKDIITNLCGGTGANSKQWVWNSRADGHFGCGPSYTSPTSWWSCGANGKAGFGMYDDIFTFGYNKIGISGSYTYDPGSGKTIYVNSGCKFNPLNAFNTNDGQDYQATVALQNATWSLEYEGNDLYITFPAGTMVGYIPNSYTYNTPKFKIIALTKDKISMVSFDGSIAWKYEFLSKALFDSGADAELLGSQYAAALPGNWKWDETTDGHFGCGDKPENATGWWSCPAEGKAGFGLYDDILSFDAKGNYTFDPGTGGTIYCNWGTYTFMDPAKLHYSGDGSTDFQEPVSKQITTYTVTNDGSKYYLQFPAKTYVSYIPSEDVYNNPKYLITKMTSNMLEFVSLGSGISWRYRFVRKN